MRRWKLRYGGAVTPVGLRPPFVTAPPQSLILIDAESHLDCRRAEISIPVNFPAIFATDDIDLGIGILISLPAKLCECHF